MVRNASQKNPERDSALYTPQVFGLYRCIIRTRWSIIIYYYCKQDLYTFRGSWTPFKNLQACSHCFSGLTLCRRGKQILEEALCFREERNNNRLRMEGREHRAAPGLTLWSIPGLSPKSQLCSEPNRVGGTSSQEVGLEGTSDPESGLHSCIPSSLR